MRNGNCDGTGCELSEAQRLVVSQNIETSLGESKEKAVACTMSRAGEVPAPLLSTGIYATGTSHPVQL
jgi:hypothetical protein